MSTAEIFVPRYPSWWDAALPALGMGAAERLVTIAVMRWAAPADQIESENEKRPNYTATEIATLKAANAGRLVEWGVYASANAYDVSRVTVRRARQHLLDAGLIRLVLDGRKDAHGDVFDATRLLLRSQPADLIVPRRDTLRARASKGAKAAAAKRAEREAA